jgi:branched-chain amino acid transport system ATP-binding protein
MESAGPAARTSGMSDAVPATPLLEVRDVSLNFGGTRALIEVSLDVQRGEVFGIIGPNGAGKTSLLNCLNCVFRPQAGHIRFDGVELVGRRTHDMIRLGIGRTFQGTSLQANASVATNILFGRDFKMKYGILAATLHWGWARNEEAANVAKVEEVLEFLQIQELRDVPAGDLPWGQQKLVEIGRALASEPKLLLLDEPTSGMTREEKEDVAACIVRMQSELGITQILIEHDARFVGDLCDRILALDFGRVIATGKSDEVLSHPEVVTAYLGATAST